MPADIRPVAERIATAPAQEYREACRALWDFPARSPERDKLVDLVKAINNERFVTAREVKTGRRGGTSMVSGPMGVDGFSYHAAATGWF